MSTSAQAQIRTRAFARVLGGGFKVSLQQWFLLGVTVAG